jgi:hypothetical protein
VLPDETGKREKSTSRRPSCPESSPTTTPTTTPADVLASYTAHHPIATGIEAKAYSPHKPPCASLPVEGESPAPANHWSGRATGSRCNEKEGRARDMSMGGGPADECRTPLFWLGAFLVGVEYTKVIEEGQAKKRGNRSETPATPATRTLHPAKGDLRPCHSLI